MNLQDALEGHTHILPFHFTGTGTASRLSAIWDILRGRSTLWFGKNPWVTIPVQEVRDLITKHPSGFSVGDPVRVKGSASDGTIRNISGDVAFMSLGASPFLHPILLSHLEPAR